MAMQSTGQGGKQSSQPMQCPVITVWISFAAPTMASTGQAAMQSVHPMHTLSSIRATESGEDSRGSNASIDSVYLASDMRVFYLWSLTCALTRDRSHTITFLRRFRRRKRARYESR